MGLVGVSEEQATITTLLATASATRPRNRRLDIHGSWTERRAASSFTGSHPVTRKTATERLRRVSIGGPGPLLTQGWFTW
jgi:hypothetical protein